MKKKILFLINTLRDGGAEKILVDIVNHLDPEKYDIEVKLIYKRGVYLDKLKSHVKLTFIGSELGTFRSRMISHMLPRFPSELLHRLFIRERYDIEAAFLEGYATKIVAGAPKGTRKLAWVHCDLTKTEWITGVYPNDRGFIKCYQKIDEVISVSGTVQEAFEKRFGMISKRCVKYNPVDNTRIRERSNAPLDIEKRPNTITLISIGRMMYPKNFIRLLQAVKHLIDDGYPVNLWLLGDGEEKEMLESYVKENNLQSHILLPGFITNPYPYMKAADLYVCSSIYEGFSTAVTEALVLGTPVLTTDVSGMREMLGDSEYGLITENTDEAFEVGLRNLLDNPGLLQHYRTKAAERSSFFEFEERLREIEKLFK